PRRRPASARAALSSLVFSPLRHELRLHGARAFTAREPVVTSPASETTTVERRRPKNGGALPQAADAAGARRLRIQRPSKQRSAPKAPMRVGTALVHRPWSVPASRGLSGS